MTATPTAIPFSRLIATDAINARGATKDGIDELAASIAAKGLIQPLSVRPASGGRLPAGESPDANVKYEVIDGRRRHAAIAKLVKAKTAGWSKTSDVPVLVRNEDDTQALETSLMANTVRLPMHPVDQHAVFARLASQGKSNADIAAAFGISEKTVRQHQALGNLALEVREAWRKGKIDAKAAQLFTLHDDHAVQTEAYKRLAKQDSYGLSEHAIRSALAPRRTPVKGCGDLKFVGEAAYLAAGGTISESLFDDDRFVDDVPLLETLVRQRLEAECERLKGEGWSWAAIGDDSGGDVNLFDCNNVRSTGEHDFNNYPEEPEAYTAEERARSGCVVELNFDGSKIEIVAGLVHPDGAPAERVSQIDIEEAIDAAGDDEGDGEDGSEIDDIPASEEDAGAPFAISQALTLSVTQTLTVAAAEAVAADPMLAMRIITAALRCRFHAPSNVRNEGNPAVRLENMGDFNDAFAALLQSGDDRVRALFCEAVGSTFELASAKWQYKGRDSGVQALRDALSADAYLDAARTHFNTADYFARAGKAVCLNAIAEMEEAGVTGPVPDTLADAKKAELADFATRHARASGWLPPELRHPSYVLLAPTTTKEQAA